MAGKRPRAGRDQKVIQNQRRREVVRAIRRSGGSAPAPRPSEAPRAPEEKQEPE